MVFLDTKHPAIIENINEDLLVVTSGAGSIFNSGIPIGKINKDVDLNNGQIFINFYKDFTQLKYVKVSSQIALVKISQ